MPRFSWGYRDVILGNETQRESKGAELEGIDVGTWDRGICGAGEMPLV